MASTTGPDSRLGNAIRSADSSAVRDALSRLRVRGTLSSGQWLPAANRYRTDVAARVEADVQSSSLHNDDLAEYMAVSALLHSADGWSYLARACHAHTVGDEPVAVHLAYYAELRAAVSLLATQGLAVLNRTHVALDAAAGHHVANGSTHVVVWDALNEWSLSVAARGVVCSLIAAGGATLGAWLDAMSPGTSSSAAAAALVRQAGLDIERLRRDRERRNEASYRPCALAWGSPSRPERAAAFLCGLWGVLEPGSASAFEGLDREVIRSVLWRLFWDSMHPTAGPEDRPTKARAAHRLRVGAALGRIGIHGSAAEHWADYLTEPGGQALWSEAEKEDDLGTPGQHRQVMARAALLLRIASGACRALVLDAGCTWADFRFWWVRLGLERAIWDDGCEPADMCDLWADVSVAMEDLTDWDAGLGVTAPSPARLHKEQAPALCALVQMERAMLWGLAT